MINNYFSQPASALHIANTHDGLIQHSQKQPVAFFNDYLLHTIVREHSAATTEDYINRMPETVGVEAPIVEAHQSEAAIINSLPQQPSAQKTPPSHPVKTKRRPKQRQQD